MIEDAKRDPDELTTLNSFLDGTGEREAFQAVAIKEVIAWRLAEQIFVLFQWPSASPPNAERLNTATPRCKWRIWTARIRGERRARAATHYTRCAKYPGATTQNVSLRSENETNISQSEALWLRCEMPSL